MSVHGTSVWTGRALQAESDDLELIGLALLYPALERNVWVPGHHGYPRASDPILGKALKRPVVPPDHGRDGETVSPSLHSSSQTSAGKPTIAIGVSFRRGAAAIPFQAAAFVTRAS